MDIWSETVPTRQENMQPYEILLSESQERMLVVLKKGEEKQVEEILEKWDLTWAQIGNITDSGNVRFYMHGELEADIPADSLVLGGGAPVYKRESKEPAYFAEANKFDASTSSESGKIIGYCAKNSEADRANEKLRASALYLLKALTAITDNIDQWLESGEPADKETSKRLYDNAKIAINKALL